MENINASFHVELFCPPRAHDLRSDLKKNGCAGVQQEADYDVFDPVRARIRSGLGSIRKVGSDYLAYPLLDTIIDH